MATVEQVYDYERPSVCTRTAAGTEVALATSGGPARHPHFWSGPLAHPRQEAAMLLAVARVARTRFYTPAAMTAAALLAADPVVTANDDRLRFESFSACAGCTPAST